MYIVRKMSCGTQAGKCALETLTTDMFSEVTINNHKCHVSGVNEQISQALFVFTSESLVHQNIQVMVGLEFLKQLFYGLSVWPDIFAFSLIFPTSLHFPSFCSRKANVNNLSVSALGSLPP